MAGLVQTIFKSIPAMANIFLLFLFFIIVFSIIGMQLFGGDFLHQCKSIADESIYTYEGKDYFCEPEVTDPAKWHSCPVGYECVKVGNPDYGLANYDNMLFAMLKTFDLITLEGWSSFMYQVRHYSNNYYYDIYSYAVVILGSFVVLNLMVAVQSDQLSDVLDQVDQQKKDVDAKKQQEILEHQQLINEDESNKPKEEDEDEEKLPPLEEGQKYKGSQVRKNIVCCRVKGRKYMCCGCWNKLSAFVYDIVEDDKFTWMITALILINSAFLATQHYDEGPIWEKIQSVANNVFTMIFLLEMILRLIGIGPTAYVKDGFNIFDGLIVILSCTEWGLSVGTSTGGAKRKSLFIVLRSFRMIRIFKIVRSWTSLRSILLTVANSLPYVGNLAFLIFLFTFIFALIGKQFFSQKPMFLEDGSPSPYRFDTIGSALVTVFVLLTGENWTEICHVTIKAYGYATSVFFIGAICIGHMMLLNLFLAILLRYISTQIEFEMKEKQMQKETKEIKLRIERMAQMSKEDFLKSEMEAMAKKKKELVIDQGIAAQAILQGRVVIDANGLEFQKLEQERKKAEAKNVDDDFFNNNDDDGEQVGSSPDRSLASGQDKREEESSDENKLRRQQTNYKSSMKYKTQVVKRKKTVNELTIEGKSLFIFAEDNWLRLKVCKLLENPYFEYFVFYLIALNSLILAIDEPVLEDAFSKKLIKQISTAISVAFIVECVLKIFVLGFVVGKFTYLKDPFNILDFTIVMISIINFILTRTSGSSSLSFMRAFRALRALRPLKLVSKNEGMKNVVNSLLNSIPALFNVLMISLLFYFVFGIMGVQVLSGRFSDCSHPNYSTKADCIDAGFKWVLPASHFNNIFNSMIVFFEISTLENWTYYLYRATHAGGIDEGVKEQSNQLIALIFIIFIFITSFFILNLFISVIVSKFSEQKMKMEGMADFNEEQKEWVKIQRYMVDAQVLVECKRSAGFRGKVFDIVENPKFEYFISIIIVLNTILMCLYYSGASQRYQNALDQTNNVLLYIFILEAVLKLTAYGPRFYFFVDWNKFDFAIIIISVLTISNKIANALQFNLTVLRIIRVARLLRMIKASKDLQGMLKTLYMAYNNIANTMTIFVLFIFVFTVAGMDIFGSYQEGNELSQDCNFSTFYLGFSTLVRCSTGENWNNIMHDYYAVNKTISVIYFILYQLFTFFIFMNVFVAVIYEEFINVKETDESSNLLSLKKSDIDGFVATWAKFDPTGSTYIKTVEFPKFLRSLHAPLGYKGVMIEDSKLNKIIYCLNIRDRQGQIYFPEVMWAIFYTIVGNNEAGIAGCLQVKNIMAKLKNKYKALGRNTSLETLCGNRFYKNEMTVTKYLSGMLIKRQIELLRQKRQAEQVTATKENQKQEKSSHLSWPKNSLHHLYLALTRKPIIIEESEEICRSRPGGKCGNCQVCNKQEYEGKRKFSIPKRKAETIVQLQLNQLAPQIQVNQLDSARSASKQSEIVDSASSFSGSSENVKSYDNRL